MINSKILSLFLVGSSLLGLVACSSAAKEMATPDNAGVSLVFPEMKNDGCSDEIERSRNSMAACEAAPAKSLSRVADELLKKFETHMEKTDRNKGRGFSNAAFYVVDQPEALKNGSPDESFWVPRQVVNFYQSLKFDGSYNRGGTAIQGTPTRVYLSRQGELAYVSFDNQKVKLLEYTAFDEKSPYAVIPFASQSLHAQVKTGSGSRGPASVNPVAAITSGFSLPIGKIKNLSRHVNEYQVDELRSLLGREGEEKTIEFESGVVVKGVIEKFAEMTQSFDGSRVLVVRFKAGTCLVTFGAHTLFKPEWGAYDMLLAPMVADSLATLAGNNL